MKKFSDSMRWFSVFGFLLFVASCVGGTLQDRIVLTFNTTALSVEAGQTTAETLYEAHQQLVVDLAAAESPLPTQAVVQGRVVSVRAAWAPIWAEFDALRTLYGQSTASLVAEGTGSDTAAKVEAAAKTFYDKQKSVAEMLVKLRDDYNQLKQKKAGVK